MPKIGLSYLLFTHNRFYWDHHFVIKPRIKRKDFYWCLLELVTSLFTSLSVDQLTWTRVQCDLQLTIWQVRVTYCNIVIDCLSTTTFMYGLPFRGIVSACILFYSLVMVKYCLRHCGCLRYWDRLYVRTSSIDHRSGSVLRKSHKIHYISQW